MMNRHLRIFLAGALMLLPFVAVLYVVIWGAGLLGGLGYDLVAGVTPLHASDKVKMVVRVPVAIGGAILILFLIYLLGLATHLLAFRRLVGMFERMLQRVPGIRTIYDSVRDLLKLFGNQSGKLGKVVLYYPKGQDIAILGILTNTSPAGLAGMGEHDMVAIYLPLGFMIGGPVLYVPRSQLREIDMPVEQALKLCATAEISPAAIEATAETLPLPTEVKGPAAPAGKN